MEENNQIERITEDEVEILPKEDFDESQNISIDQEKAAKFYEKVNETLDKTLEVSEEIKSYSEIQPNNGYRFREELNSQTKCFAGVSPAGGGGDTLLRQTIPLTGIIREAKDMTTKEKLAASRENDEFEMEKLERVKDVANEVRDNKAKNCVYIILAAAVVVGVPVCLSIPESRKLILNAVKSAGKICIRK